MVRDLPRVGRKGGVLRACCAGACAQALQRINSSVSSSDVKRHLAYMQEFGSV
jgi:hypothetical protein